MNKKSVNVEKMNSRLDSLTKDMSSKYSAIVKFKTPSDTGDNTTSSNNSTTSSTPSTNTPKPTHTHLYSAATCTNPEKCSCGAIQGKALGHKWVNATCTAPKTCSVCKTTQGAAIGHKLTNGKCSVCNTKDPNFKEYDTYINGVGYYLGQELTVEIILKTNDIDIDVCPCFTTYKKANNSWVPYDMTADFEDFWGEEPTIQSSHGGPMETDDAVYGHWCWMGTSFTEKDGDFDFSKGNVIRRLKFKVTEKGEFEFRIQDGQYPEQNNNKYTNALSVKVY